MKNSLSRSTFIALLLTPFLFISNKIHAQSNKKVIIKKASSPDSEKKDVDNKNKFVLFISVLMSSMESSENVANNIANGNIKLTISKIEGTKEELCKIVQNAIESMSKNILDAQNKNSPPPQK
jgi:hypothetical protein